MPEKKQTKENIKKVLDENDKKSNKKVEKTDKVKNLKREETNGKTKKANAKKEAKTVKKKAKKDDGRIKQIISEQLANMEKLNKKAEEIKKDSIELSEKEENIKSKNTIKRNKYDPEKIAKEIENKKKLPKEEKIKLRKQAIINLLIASAVTFYGIFLMMGLKNIEPKVFVTDLKFFSISLIIITILIFESAYKKDSESLALHGVEALIVSILTLVSIYVYILYTNIFMFYVFGFSVISIVYNLIKSIVIYIRGKKQYKRTISDIKDIVEE